MGWAVVKLIKSSSSSWTVGSSKEEFIRRNLFKNRWRKVQTGKRENDDVSFLHQEQLEHSEHNCEIQIFSVLMAVMIMVIIKEQRVGRTGCNQIILGLNIIQMFATLLLMFAERFSSSYFLWIHDDHYDDDGGWCSAHISFTLKFFSAQLDNIRTSASDTLMLIISWQKNRGIHGERRKRGKKNQIGS